MKKYIAAAMLISTPAMAETTQDHFKQVIMKKPYTVEVCTDQTVSGDKTSDTLMGALIGGAIGNNVTKNVDNGGAVGALLGGMIAHNNSKNKDGTRRVCSTETRYEEEYKEVYSHSTVTFVHEGRQYILRFNK